MKILLPITLLILSSTSSYGAFNTGERNSGYSGGYKTDIGNGNYNNKDSQNDFYENDISGASDEDAFEENNTSKVTSPTPEKVKPAPAATFAKEKEKKPVAIVPKSNPDAGKKIQKVTKGDVVTYSWASPQQEVKDGAEVEIIDVATAPTGIAGFGGSPKTKQSRWASQFTMFQQDENGWSIIKPQVDSRIIFVSSSEGDDSKAQAYFSKNIGDPHNPNIKIIAFKTIEKAKELLRDGYPDWILLKKGDQWKLNQTIFLPSGRSALAPLVLTSYGTSNSRPLINTETSAAIKLTKARSFIAVVGIEFYANKRDPGSIDFVGWDNVTHSSAFSSHSADTKGTESILLEDNIFNFFGGGVGFHGGHAGCRNIIVRRNQILNMYSVKGHSQGIYSTNCSLLLEENLLDHNGWFQQNYEALNSAAKGQATFFNHNAYLANQIDSVITGNIFSRASSIGLKLTSNPDKNARLNNVMAKNIVIQDNLFLEGEIGISAGGNTDFNNGYRWENISINDNVLMNIGNTQPTRRALAWHIDVQDWDGGSVQNNYLLFNDNENIKNIFGIQLSGFTRNVDVTSNVVRSLGGKAERMIYQVNNEILKNINVRDNDIIMDIANKESRRDLLSYFGLGGKSNGVEHLVEQAKTQAKGNWNQSYTASEINKFLMD